MSGGERVEHREAKYPTIKVEETTDVSRWWVWTLGSLTVVVLIGMGLAGGRLWWPATPPPAPAAVTVTPVKTRTEFITPPTVTTTVTNTYLVSVPDTLFGITRSSR